MSEIMSAQYGYGITGGFFWLPILLLFILVLAIFPLFAKGGKVC